MEVFKYLSLYVISILVVGFYILSPTDSYQSCDPVTGSYSTSSQPACLLVQNFDHYQYAYCMTDEQVRNFTNNAQKCSDDCRTYCYLTCMAALHQVYQGAVASECRCDPGETTDARTQMPVWCSSPEGQCDFYDTCIIPEYTVCQNMTEIRSMLKAQCQWLTEVVSNETDCDIKAWAKTTRRCFQQQMVRIQRMNSYTCEQVHHSMYPNLFHTCINATLDVNLCNLPLEFRTQFVNGFLLDLTPGYFRLLDENLLMDNVICPGT